MSQLDDDEGRQAVPDADVEAREEEGEDGDDPNGPASDDYLTEEEVRQLEEPIVEGPELQEDDSGLRELNVFVGTWNMNNKALGESLLGWLEIGLTTDNVPPDVMVVGLQEMDLAPAAFVSLETKRGVDWGNWLVKQSDGLCEGGNGYVLVCSRQLVGVAIFMLVRKGLGVQIGVRL